MTDGGTACVTACCCWRAPGCSPAARWRCRTSSAARAATAVLPRRRRGAAPDPVPVPMRSATAERALHGVIVRVEGEAPTQGYYGAELRPLGDGAPDAAGVVSFRFVAMPPADGRGRRARAHPRAVGGGLRAEPRARARPARCASPGSTPPRRCRCRRRRHARPPSALDARANVDDSLKHRNDIIITISIGLITCPTRGQALRPHRLPVDHPGSRVSRGTARHRRAGPSGRRPRRSAAGSRRRRSRAAPAASAKRR